MLTRDEPLGANGGVSPAPNRSPETKEVLEAEQYPWYAIRVRSHFERVVSTYLKQKGLPEFTPFYRSKRRWSDRTKLVDFPLFPGYVFCRFDPQKRLPILQTPGVVSVVSFGSEYIPVDEGEIEAVQRVMMSGEEVRPWPYLRIGQKVRVKGGALDGIEGLLLDLKNGRRLVVSITILQRSVATEIDRDGVEPVY